MSSEIPSRTVRPFVKRIVVLVLVVLLVWFIARTWSVIRAPVIPQQQPLVVNDVSQLNPIHVAEVITPTSTAKIVETVKQHSGPIAIGGARHQKLGMQK